MSSIAALIRSRALREGDEFQLASGQKSRVYVNCKELSLHGPSLAQVSGACWDFLSKQNPIPDAVAGVSIGGDPLVGGILVAAAQVGVSLHGLLVRPAPKSHGLSAGRAVEGVLSEQTKNVWLVEDVISTGGSALKACASLKREGYQVVGILALVDRDMGGMDAINRGTGVRVHALTRLSELQSERP